MGGVVSSFQPTDSVSVADRIKPSAHKSPKPSNKVVDAKKDHPSSIQENEDKDDESLGTIIKSQESSSRGTMKKKSKSMANSKLADIKEIESKGSNESCGTGGEPS